MILSIDTFSEILGISLLNKDLSLKVNLEYRQVKPFSEIIIKKIDDILSELNIEKSKISKIVVNKGPGGYTGLRVGITTAKMLAYALEVPIYSYISLDVMEYMYKNTCKSIVPAINAGKNEAYIKLDRNIKLIKQEQLIQYLDDNSLCICKNLDIPSCINITQSLAYIGGVYAIKNSLEDDVFKLEPVYLRNL